MRPVAAYAPAFAVMFALILSGGGPGVAGDGRVPLPHPPKGAGVSCIASVPDMRRNHMNYLLHQRDETVRGGIRGNRFALRDCIGCHATPVKGSASPKLRSVKPFCSECHSYAAVRIDCFSCHTPETTEPLPGARRAEGAR